MLTTHEAHSWRRRVHDVLESGMGADRASTLVNLGLVLLICLNVIAFAVETVPEIGGPYAVWFQLFDIVSVTIFSLEYACRVWSAVEQPILSHMPPWRARIAYAARPMSIIDLAAVLPFFLSLFLPTHNLEVLRVLRLFRFLKIARYSGALHSLGRVVAEERGALMGTLVIMLSLILFAATGMYMIEREIQPKAFGTIPQAMWWALVTLATIGYGDVVPLTTAGKLFAGLVIVLGMGVFALPIAIIATGFSREVTRREFVVTWSLVARVPLFAGLNAAALAEIMTLLTSRTFEAGDLILRRGEEARALYCIASGEAVVELDDSEVRLGEGDVLGELALIEHRTHRHAVVAGTRCRCLVLERDDLERLGRRHPEIVRRVREVALQRAAGKAGGAPAT